jgi:peptide/nickel transport system ATP-binding protein
MNEPILQVKNLKTQLRIGGEIYTVVDNLSFTLESGKTLAIVGESGCGKTMAAQSILRILPTPPALHPTGEVLHKGKNLLSLSEKEMRAVRGAQISMIFQDPMSALNPVYTVGSQLMEVATLHLGLDDDEAYERAVQALKDVAMPLPHERMEAYPHQLSGGMKQRVMIAMALICNPSVLIADEPTTALDVTIQAQILELMKSLQQSRGMAILLITHDMGVVSQMADDIIVMYATQPVETASKTSLSQKVAHPYTQGLFKSLPSRHKRGERLSVIEGSVPPITSLPTGCHFHPRCPYVMEKCKQGEVPFFTQNEASHKAKCWLYEK